MGPRSIGDKELELFKLLEERDGATVGEAAELFGAGRGLSRTTVLTMMERLREKGFLKRRRVDGVFRYQPVPKAREVMLTAVRDFVEGTLSGSVAPFVAYLSERRNVSDEELAQLEDAVARLAGRKEEP